MALSTARIHRVRGRPPLLAAGITSLIHSHSSSVRSLGYIFSFIYPFYTIHEDFSDRLLERETAMAFYDIFWNDEDEDGNVAHIAEHGLTPEDVNAVLIAPEEI